MDDDFKSNGPFQDDDQSGVSQGGKLAENNDTPFSEPDGQASVVPPDHPQTDSNIDSHELYDEGISGAAEIEKPRG